MVLLLQFQMKLTCRALADTHNRGALDLTEFTIAMHLIQSLMTNKISAVPASLPPDLFTAASAGQFQQSHVQRTPSVSSTSSGRAPTLPPKIQQSPIRTTFTGGSQFDSDGWDVSPADKINFDSLFRSIDNGNKGFIDGMSRNEYI
jgi:epidermal growth factor receptor substrate 15